jgi:hypothetical protein
MGTAFASLVAASLKKERFTLVDLGCSGGIESTWRLFGDRFRAVGFDASVDECRRLAANEPHPDVDYVAGFTDISPDHPFAILSRGTPHLTRSSWTRLSAARIMELRDTRLKAASTDEKLQHNAWSMTELADPTKPVIVPQVLIEKGISDIDLLKIDIDGSDFRVLNSFDGMFDTFKLFAARMEVNLYGGAGETVHTFSNTDRFMRERKFELVGLEPRLYAMKALPAPFAFSIPAQTVSGRTFQAEAYYVRDFANPDEADAVACVSDEKLAKLAAIFSLWNQPDGAAELLLTFRQRLAPLLDVDCALDLLAAQAQPGRENPLRYRDYLAKFEADSPDFYPKPWIPPPPSTLGRRLAAAWRSFLDPNRTA